MDPLPAKRDAGIRHSWRVWLVVGLCFGLGYGLTQRFTALQRSEGGSIQQRFRAKPPPGTRLDDLRRRSGDDDADLQPDLDRLARDREEQEEKRKELEERRRELEERESARRDEEEDWDDFPAEPESPPTESRRRVTEPEPEPVRQPTFDSPRADSVPLPDRIESPPARSFPEPPPLPAPRPSAPPPPLP
jgi:hypothetical protein